MLAAPSFVRRLLLAACAAAALATATGCTPVVSLHHTEVRGLSSSGLALVAVMEVENENAFDVEVRGVRADVTIAGRYRLEPIDVQPHKWIPADGKVKVAVPVTVPWSIVPGLLAETVSASHVPYRVHGTADVTASRSLRVKRSHYPIDQEGEIPRSSFARGGGGFPFPIP